MAYLCSYMEIVDGRIVSTGKAVLEWKTKIHSLKDFDDFEKAVCKMVGKEVKIHTPLLLD